MFKLVFFKKQLFFNALEYALYTCTNVVFFVTCLPGDEGKKGKKQKRMHIRMAYFSTVRQERKKEETKIYQ